MSRGRNQKLKLMYLAKILVRKTDAEHSLSMSEIRELLEKEDITADRRSIYSDIEILRRHGLDIRGVQKGWNYFYHVEH